MTLYGDYHTHTVFSHGKGSIEDNVRAAVAAGLKEIAITDHGFGHSLYNVKRENFEVMKAERDRLGALYPDINIYIGLETNLISADGDVDVTREEAEKLEMFVCGYHRMVHSTAKSLFKFRMPIFFSSVFGTSRKARIRNTDAYIKALEKYDIDIISHPNFGIGAYVDKIAEAAAHFGTYLELNGKRIAMTVSEIEAAAKTGVKFIADSDAHTPSRVGDVSLPLKIAAEAGVTSLIANLGAPPVFRSRKNQVGNQVSRL